MSTLDDHPLPWSALRRLASEPWRLEGCDPADDNRTVGGSVAVWDVHDANRALVVTVTDPLSGDGAHPEQGSELDEADTTHGAANVMQLARAYVEAAAELRDEHVHRIDVRRPVVAVTAPGFDILQVFSPVRGDRFGPQDAGDRGTTMGHLASRTQLLIMRAMLTEATATLDRQLAAIDAPVGPASERAVAAADLLSQVGGDRYWPGEAQLDVNETMALRVLVNDVRARGTDPKG